MQKIAVLILFVPFIAGCATLRKSNMQNTSGIVRDRVNCQDIKRLNLSNTDFNIIKADIVVTGNDEKEKILANIKYQKDGTFLISMRNKSGIEGARVFLTKDTILVNDRINRELYYGSAVYLETKYGIATEMLPIILGDLVTDTNKKETLNCNKNTTFVSDIISGKEISYTIDCGKRKISNVSVKDRFSGKKINIELSNFVETEEYTIATRITITTENQQEKIDVSIEKLDIGLEREITFIPGKNYEKILLR